MNLILTSRVTKGRVVSSRTDRTRCETFNIGETACGGAAGGGRCNGLDLCVGVGPGDVRSSLLAFSRPSSIFVELEHSLLGLIEFSRAQPPQLLFGRGPKGCALEAFSPRRGGHGSVAASREAAS